MGAPREIDKLGGFRLTTRARMVIGQDSDSSKKEHPMGITVSGMFIVCYHRAAKISGTGGAMIVNNPARLKYRLICASYIYELKKGEGSRE